MFENFIKVNFEGLFLIYWVISKRTKGKRLSNLPLWLQYECDLQEHEIGREADIGDAIAVF